MKFEVISYVTAATKQHGRCTGGAPDEEIFVPIEMERVAEFDDLAQARAFLAQQVPTNRRNGFFLRQRDV